MTTESLYNAFFPVEKADAEAEVRLRELENRVDAALDRIVTLEYDVKTLVENSQSADENSKC